MPGAFSALDAAAKADAVSLRAPASAAPQAAQNLPPSAANDPQRGHSIPFNLCTALKRDNLS
jgi:hypothetical protein